jgi:hypothetical protein
MNFPAVFLPPRQRGLLLNAASAVLLGLVTTACFTTAFNQPVGSSFVLLLLIAALLCLPLVLILYRIYALLSASYTIERDGLRLRWGLRAEDIPIPEVEWVRPASDLALPLPKPIFSWPGALIGSVRTTDLGLVEFLAAENRTLLLVATSTKIYAVSPADPGGFTSAFRRTTEMGSLLPIQSYSTRPAAYVTHVWQDRAARILTSAGLGLAVILFVAVSLGIGGRATIPLGFGPDRQPLEPVPAVQVLLLPVLAGLAYAADLILGFFFYRREERRPLAYLLWAGGVITPLTFLIAAFFIL